MPIKKNTKPTLPVIRLTLLTPMVRELERRNIDYQSIFSEFAVALSELNNPNAWVPAPKLYALVERCSEVSGDPCFGVHSGEKLDPWSWSPTANAASLSKTVGEFLLRFMEDAGSDANSCTFVLETVGQRTTFQERRVMDGKVMPRHNDGYTVAYLLAILRGAMGPDWDGRQVMARVCDPGVVPHDYLGIRTAVTDTFGASVSFPSRWLLRPLFIPRVRDQIHSQAIDSTPVDNIVDAFRLSILPFIHESGLNAERVAKICGINKRTLARKLKRRGTSASNEINTLRKGKAERELQESNRTIAAIAMDVGYEDPVVFARAFKRWTGRTPSQFRKEHRSFS